jgi:hypothetical protein
MLRQLAKELVGCEATAYELKVTRVCQLRFRSYLQPFEGGKPVHERPTPGSRLDRSWVAKDGRCPPLLISRS